MNLQEPQNPNTRADTSFVPLTFALMVGVFALYLGAIGAGPLYLDDPTHVFIPQLMAQFDFELLKTLWTPGSHVDFYPVRDLSYALNYLVFGHRWEGWRLTQLTIYLGSIACLLALLREIGVSRATTLLVGAIWALNPAHAEMLIWLTARKDALQMFFALSATLAYIKAYKARSTKLFVLALFLFVLGVLSKAGVLLLPALGLLAYLLGWRDKKALLTTGFGFGVAGLFGALEIWFYSNVSVQSYPVDFASRVLAASAALGRAFLGWFDPSLNGLDLLSWGEWVPANGHFAPVGAAIAGAYIALSVVLMLKAERKILLCLAASVLMFVPVSGLVFQSRNLYSVRYLEMMMIPLFVALAIFFDRYGSRRWLGPVLGCLVAVSVWGTFREAEVWSSPMATLQKGLEREPESVRLRLALISHVESSFALSELTHEEQAKTRSRLSQELDSICSESKEPETQATCALFWSKAPLSREEFEARFPRSTLLYSAWRPQDRDAQELIHAIASGAVSQELALKVLAHTWQIDPQARMLKWFAVCLSGDASAASTYLDRVVRGHLLKPTMLMAQVQASVHPSLIERIKPCLGGV